nr:MAG TPA: hypothetical protein [Caudoviricetes sp.]
MPKLFTIFKLSFKYVATFLIRCSVVKAAELTRS